jgi:hypothetical protein
MTSSFGIRVRVELAAMMLWHRNCIEPPRGRASPRCPKGRQYRYTYGQSFMSLDAGFTTFDQQTSSRAKKAQAI